ncbi:MAG: response regulator [Hyphomicrobiaceae bacterium]|nr:response regulator [Hyphomicrobiaceae bacterium]
MTSPAPNVLVVEDEPQMRRFLRAGFELDGFQVHEAETAAAGVRLATLRPFDLIIVDLGLPDKDGSHVVERVRSWSTVPMIVLSVRSHEDEKVRLLDTGADDYVVKPFGMAELLARTRAALRRKSPASVLQPIVGVGPLSIDLAHRIVERQGVRIQLTPKEFRLLQILAQHAGKVVTHQHLLREIWGAAHIDAAHYLRILVRKIRKKIEVNPTQPAILLTELGVGYRLAAPRDQHAGT